MVSFSCILALASVTLAAGSFQACNPCAQKCAVPCNSPSAALPVVWDKTVDKPDAVIQHGEFNLNPYNSVRPEYRDAPPSKADLEKIWQHHLKDHAYKTPFVRTIKSGLWQAGVPNRYAPSGYNRRMFKTEEEALQYVRHKTGAGSSIDYQSALRTEAETKGADPTHGGYSHKGSVREHVKDRQPKGITAKDVGTSLIEKSSSRSRPTLDEDRNELESTGGGAQEKELTDDEEHVRESRDHHLKISHKIRDFLANYRPEHEVSVVGAGFEA